MKEKQFDEFVDNLQQEIIQKEIEDFNERIVKLFHNPLKVNNNKIEQINFITDGCGASVAAGAQLTLLAENKSLDEAEELTPEELDKELQGLPEDHKHCALLAIRTLKSALKNYKETNL
ncbi:MAG: iron-sulfur cluster assembly scaffold protein [Candidatus Lokiarchaeota archaeon]